MDESNQLIMRLATLSQPDTNMNRNCTAALMFLYGYPTGWIAVPCDAALETTFFCVDTEYKEHGSVRNVSGIQSIFPIPDGLWHASGRTCERNWTMIGSRCFVFLHMPKDITFYQAENMCTLRGGHLPNMYELELTNISYSHNHELNHLFRDSLNPEGALYFEITSNNLQAKIALGLPIPNIQSNSDLISIMTMLTRELSDTMITLLAKHASLPYCWLIVHSFWQVLYPTPVTSKGSWLEDWGGKFRPCTEKVEATILICEVESRAYQPRCRSKEFTCSDKTCISSAYVCDGVEDCSGGLDEKCLEIPVTDRSIDVLVPCSLNDGTIGDYIPLHAFCDGIHTCSQKTASPLEVEVCSYRPLAFISFSTVQSTKRYMPTKSVQQPVLHTGDIYALAINEFIFYNMLLEGPKEQTSYSGRKYGLLNNSGIATESSRLYTWICSGGYHQGLSFKEMCLLNTYKAACNVIFHRFCTHVQCPGMFKCKNTYCLHMSSVCDGKRDCRYGEDEAYCSNLSCPGLLKCRGETRCLSVDQLCNGHPDCKYSYDDEINCNNCPTSCHCEHFTIRCSIKDATAIVNIKKHVFVKAVKIQKVAYEIDTTLLLSKHWIYFDVSLCGIKVILRPDNILADNAQSSSILIANFSHNLLESTNFSSALKRMVIIDLSYNLLEFFFFKYILHIQSLRLIILNNNPLRHIDVSMTKQLYHLHIVQVKSLLSRPREMVISEPVNVSDAMFIHVTDGEVCCALNAKVTCMVTVNSQKCNGLFPNNAGKIVSTMFTVGSVILSGACTVYHGIQILNHEFGKYYFIALSNRGISDLLVSAYLLCLFVADLADVSGIWWQQHVMCRLLNALSYIALQSCAILKSIVGSVVLIKIFRPFKHQCRWLFYMWPISGMAWLVTISVYIIISFALDNHWDRYCSNIGCDSNDKDNFEILLLSFTVDLVFLLIMLFLFILTIMKLRRGADDLVDLPNTRKTISVVTIFQSITPLLLELFIKIPIYVHSITKYHGLHLNKSSCTNIIIYFLPVKLILSSIFYMTPLLRTK